VNLRRAPISASHLYESLRNIRQKVQKIIGEDTFDVINTREDETTYITKLR